MLFWQRREVLVTNSGERYGRATGALTSAGIEYRTRYVDTAARTRGRGSLIGSIGARPDLTGFYYIYVKRPDYERAKHIINSVR